MGLDHRVLEKRQKDSLVTRIKHYELRLEWFEDTRKDSSGRPNTRHLSDVEKIKCLEQKNSYLNQENEFLKKQSIGPTGKLGIRAKVPIKYKLIKKMIEQHNNLLNISLLCQIAQVSRLGYYQWQSNADTRTEKEEQDNRGFELILEAYRFRGYDKFSRGIHMLLLNQKTRMNREKTKRLMDKYGLLCQIRKANPYRRMARP